jgi:hypothetical protein
MATIGGMAWARAAIFYGSDFGKDYMQRHGCGGQREGGGGSAFAAFLASALPPLVCSTLVQVANMPLIRSTITIQNPASELHTVRASMQVKCQVSVRPCICLPACLSPWAVCANICLCLWRLQHIYHTKGLGGLWHGLSAGKTRHA